jgi:hypothetical protein
MLRATLQRIDGGQGDPQEYHYLSSSTSFYVYSSEAPCHVLSAHQLYLYSTLILLASCVRGVHAWTPKFRLLAQPLLRGISTL